MSYSPRDLFKAIMFTVKQAAEHLGVSAALVYSLCAAGKIRHERYGLGRGTIRISEEALQEYRHDCEKTVERTASEPNAPKSKRPTPHFQHLKL